jgi:hypothetical protein
MVHSGALGDQRETSTAVEFGSQLWKLKGKNRPTIAHSAAAT